MVCFDRLSTGLSSPTELRDLYKIGVYMFGKKMIGFAAVAALVGGLAIETFATNVACVGNSITEGYGIDWGEKKYPDRLQELLQPGDSAANFGTSPQSGATRAMA